MVTTVDSRREIASLIGSDKVDGTPVYGADDRKIGSVQRVMIDKAREVFVPALAARPAAVRRMAPPATLSPKPTLN
jgi:hypothetical protein